MELELPNIKTMAALCNYLRMRPIHNISILKWRSLYQVTIGDHDNNTFMTVDLSNKSSDWCQRWFNGKNYDLGSNGTMRMTLAGREKLIDFLNNQITQKHH